MPKPTTKATQFFLTRQTANILEDLSRSGGDPGSVCLLYGAAGVGKSSLLEQFRKTRHVVGDCCIVRFLDDVQCQLQQGDKLTTPIPFSVTILGNLRSGTVLIIDDFDMADETLQQQVFAFWSEQGRAKNLHLIISGTARILKQVMALQQSSGMGINSVELRGLDKNESHDYIKSRICKAAGYKLSNTRQLRKLISQANGLIGHLDLLIDQHRTELECVEDSGVKSRNHYLAIVAMIGLVVVLGILVPERALLDKWIGPQSADVPVVSMSNHQDTDLPKGSGVGSIQLDNQYDTPSVANTQVTTPTVSAPPMTVAVDPVFDKTPENEVNAPVPAERVQPTSLLQQRKQATHQWLVTANDSQASIQVMALVSNSRNEDSLSGYLQSLVGEGIDLDQIYIYTAKKKNAYLHGVLYGDYTNRKRAVQQIPMLPEALSGNGPIPRTVRGIRQEIGEG